MKMKITTSKGKTLDVNWAFGPTDESGSLMIELPDKAERGLFIRTQKGPG